METKTINLLNAPGIVRDVPPRLMPENAFSEGRNVRFHEKGAESLAGDTLVLSTAPIAPLWLQAFPPISAPKWVYADLNQVYAVDGTTHTEITRVSGNYVGSVSERWQSTVLNGVAVLNNTVDAPQAWTNFEPTTRLVDLPNWNLNLRAKSIRAFLNYLVALNITESGNNRPYRVLWSDSAVAGTLPGSWDTTDPATDSREFDLASTSDHLVDQLPMGLINIIYKERSTWGMAPIGPPNYFRFWNILSGQGLLARDCVVDTPRGHVVVTQDDIIRHRGQESQSESVIGRKLRRWLFKNIDPSNFRNSFMFKVLRNSEVCFCYPSVGSTYADTAVIWNWDDNSVGVKEITETPFISVGPVGSTISDDISWD